MHFTTPLFFAIGLTSASVLPRASQYGTWSVSLNKSAYANGYKSETVVANFTSSSYPSGIVSTCEYVYNPAATPKETSGCDNEAFSYEYDGQTIKLQQNVELPTPQTVFGEGALTTKSDAVGRTFTGEAVVEVSSAIA